MRIECIKRTMLIPKHQLFITYILQRSTSVACHAKMSKAIFQKEDIWCYLQQPTATSWISPREISFGACCQLMTNLSPFNPFLQI